LPRPLVRSKRIGKKQAQERSFPAGRVWLERAGDGYNRQEDLEKLNPAEVWQGWVIKAEGVNPDGKASSASRHGASSGGLKWEEIPADVREVHEAAWPICACGRARFEAAKFVECRLCRQYVNCPRCGEFKYAGEERVAMGESTCSDCARYFEEREGWVHQYLTARDLVKLRRQARALAKAEAVIDDDEELLETAAGCFRSGFEPEQLARLARLPGSGNALVKAVDAVVHGQDRERYYPDFTEQGVQQLKARLDAGEFVLGEYVQPRTDEIRQIREAAEGLKARLEVIGGDSSAHGVGYSWVSDTRRLIEYFNTKGKSMADLQAILAGVEARISLAEWHKTLVGEHGAEAAPLAPLRRFLAKTEAGVAEAERVRIDVLVALSARQEAIVAGEIWPDVEIVVSEKSRVSTDIWAVDPSGEVLEPEKMYGRHADLYAYRYGDLPTSVLVLKHTYDNYTYRDTEVWEVCRLPKVLTAAQQEVVGRLAEETWRYFTGPGTDWDLSQVGAVVFSTPYHRDFTGEEKEAQMRFSAPIDVEQYETRWDEEMGATVVGPYKQRDPRVKKLQELREELERLGYDVQGAEMTKDIEAEEYEQSELLAASRLEADFGVWPVAEGDIFEVEFHEENRRGETSLVVGPFWDGPSGTWVKLVENPYHNPQPEPEVRCLVKVEARNSEQLHLFSYVTDNPEGVHGRGGRKVRVWGYFAVPIMGPDDYDRDIAQTQARLAEVTTKIAQLEADIASNPPQRQLPKSTNAAPETEPIWIEDGGAEERETAMAVAFARALKKG